MYPTQFFMDMFQENLNIIIIVMFPVKCFDVLIPGNTPPYHELTSRHLLRKHFKDIHCDYSVTDNPVLIPGNSMVMAYCESLPAFFLEIEIYDDE